MREYTVEEKNVTLYDKVLTKAVCNRCGKEVTNKKESPWEVNEIHNITIDFGYGSKFDLQTWNFDLCDECLEGFVKTFKIPPEIREIS